jgi:subtilisin
MPSLLRASRVDFGALREAPLAPVHVAVIDSGIDATHPELASRIECAHRAARTEDGRYEARRLEVPCGQDEHGHGTSVAGIITEIAPNARLHDYRIFGETDSSVAEGLTACMAAAIESGVRLINLSLVAKASLADRVLALLERAYRRGVVVVASKRNFPLRDLGLPAELSYCIGVDVHGSPDPFDLAYRPTSPVRFVARGERVRTTVPGGGWGVVTGTSFATPTVTGLCALLLGTDPELTEFEIKALLKASARRLED